MAALDCILNSCCNLRVPFCNQVLCLKNSFVVVQLPSHVHFCETPWIAAHQAFPSITISQFAQTHVYWVSDAIQPAHPLLPPSSPALNHCQHQDLFQWVDSSHQVPSQIKKFPGSFLWSGSLLFFSYIFFLLSLISFAGLPIASFHLAPLSQLFLFPSLLLSAF